MFDGCLCCVEKRRKNVRECDVAREAALAAGELLRAEAVRAGGPRGADMKAPVDEEIGALLCERLHAVFPEDAIICEEGGGVSGHSGRAFVIDPHDGTRDFLRGRRETSISIGLVDNGRLIMGLVYAPMQVPLFDGGSLLVTWHEGGELLCNGETVSPEAASGELTEESLVLMSTRVQGERLVQNQEALAPAKLVHCASIATRLALVAIGKADAAMTINHTLQPWDFAGGQALVQAAGGLLVGAEGDSIAWTGIAPAETNGYYGARSASLAPVVAGRMKPLLV
jgi:fructose-1,6-bisphosphatase/inositol monophosphatase family enzyme